MYLFLILFIIIPKSFSCEVSQEDHFSFTTSIVNRDFFAFKNNGATDFIPFFKVSNCEKIARLNKYLMVAFGPQNQELSDRVQTYDIANNYNDSGCQIQNNPFKETLDYRMRKKYLDEKWHAIKNCYEIVVTEENSSPIDTPEKQPGCKSTLRDKNELVFNGGYCFIKPKVDSSYLINFNIKEACLDYGGLKKLNISVFDFQSVLNFYTAGDATGSSLELTSIKSYPLRFNVSPNPNILSSSEQNRIKSPEYPSFFFLPDTHLGIPELKISKPKSVNLRVPLWVDNNCSKICVNDFCQGLCDYNQPIVGEIQFFEIYKNKIIDLETSWYQGGIVLPHYQGEISGTGIEIPKEIFEIGKSYRIIMNFNDPKFDFENYKKYLKPLIKKFNLDFKPINSSSIPQIPLLRPIESNQEIPVMDGIAELNFSNRLSDKFDVTVNQFSNLFDYKFWPPFYEGICHKKICKKIQNKYLTLILDFKINSFLEKERKYGIEVLRLKRESKFLSDYEKVAPKMPEVKCRF